MPFCAWPGFEVSLSLNGKSIAAISFLTNDIPDNALIEAVLGANSTPPNQWTWLNQSVGQIFQSYYPMWVRKNMVRPSGEVILLTERSYSEQTQTTSWVYGYDLRNPAAQMWSAGGVYGFPMLHATKGKEKIAMFNYLFADYHVQTMSPRDTVRDKSTLAPTYSGGDFMWTIRPYDLK